MILDYETMRLIWWALLGALLIGFAITDGFDMGVAVLLPFLGKNDTERRVIINSIGTVWEGNQVWFITAGGALFAAWPIAYAVAFSGFYFALLLTLFALFLRPIGFDYRSKLPSPKWRNNWDIALFVGGFVPSLIFGVAFGNLLQGVPFHLDNDMRIFYTGSFWALLNPFALAAGLVSLSMLVMHGAVYLQLKTGGDINRRCKKVVPVAAIVTLALFAAAGIWVANIDGYHISSEILPNAPSNPLAKIVQKGPGLWLDNYEHYPVLSIIPALAFIAGALTIVLSKIERPGLAFIASSLTLTAIILTAGVSMFPFLMPSSSMLNSSLTIWDASSSLTTLKLMLLATLIFLPIVLAYTTWVFRILRGKITPEHIHQNDHTVI
ncbi:cytochrome d ubiquinol oxidase subunit II [Candidatus Methylobacter oryzae]|uniref:Cytochrome d ubiquinol oxidase subunit II n=1 Tax=Candidatus Methylobacter oryzae TaxID=2497749 RepID=A0ABY3CEG9_9GAMM|nr:cytochrome d ubiquinol oxidase subunit II [Candidatus Methylobacter oryzae]